MQEKGYYSSQCFGKSVTGIAGNDHTHPDAAFIDTIHSNSDTSWSSDIQHCGKTSHFKLDTGAEVTAVSNSKFRLLNTEIMEKPSKTLYRPDHQPLDIIGQFTIFVTYNGNNTKQLIFIIKGLTMNLFRLPAIQALKIISKSDSISQPQITRKVNFSIAQSIDTVSYNVFPKFFQGLGNVVEEHKSP